MGGAASDAPETSAGSRRSAATGLSLVHETVEASGGSMTLESAPGKATVVTLSLPLAS